MANGNTIVWETKTTCIECGGIYPDHNEGCSFRGKNGWTKTGGTHEGCGGNIITRRDCTECDKCGKAFCGCAAG